MSVSIDLSGISLVLASSFGWAAVDACKKVLADRMRTLPVVIFLSFGQMLLFTVWASWEGKFLVSHAYLYPALGSVILNILANIIFMKSLNLSAFSATVPLLALSPVFTTLAAFFLLGEWPDSRQIAGILTVVLGALILNLRFEGFNSLWTSFLQEKGSLYMVGVALLFSLGATLDKAAVKQLSSSSHAVVLSGGVALGLFTVLAINGELEQLKQIKNHFKPLIYAVVFSGIALGFQLVACQKMLMSLFESLKTVAFVFTTLIIGRLFFKEHISKRKIAAAILISGGVIMLM